MDMFVIFADDTNMFFSGLDAMQLSRHVSNELEKVLEWFVVNTLIFNVDKANFLVFGNSMQLYIIVQASIDNNDIKIRFVTKF